MTAEKLVQNKILAYLKKLEDEGHPVTKERRQAGGFGYKKGLPDVYFTYAGIHVEIEVKKPGGQLASAQRTWQMIFKRRQVMHFVIDDIDDFKRLMNAFIDNREYIEQTMLAIQKIAYGGLE